MRPSTRKLGSAGRRLALLAILWCSFGCSTGAPAAPSFDGAVAEPASDGGADAGAAEGGCVRDLPTCPAAPPSYQQTVAAVLRRRCVACHYAGSAIARGDFTTYAGVKADYGSALDQVYGCLMPPQDAGALSGEERTELMTWLVCGAPNN